MAAKYVPATEVISPKLRWALIIVLEDKGPGEHSLALGRWDNDPVLAMRWNGDKENLIGNPQSRGVPTWFIIPHSYDESILKTLPPEKRKLASNFLPTSN